MGRIVNSRMTFLATTSLLCVSMVVGAQAQEPSTPPENSQESDSLGFSLSELEALIEEDSSESASSLIEGQLFDLAVLSTFLLLVAISFFRKSAPLKYLTLVFSVAYLGFLKSSLLSVVNIFALTEWSFPLFRYNISWYLLAVFTVISTVLWGRLYCGRICSFGALTQLLDKLLPSKLRVELPHRIERRAIYVKYFILGTAIAYFLLTRDNTIYRYIEPFWMFTLRGSTVMWIMLGLLLLVTVFIRNFYCRYLCPLGAALGLVSNLTIFGIKRWSECKTCKICEKTCEWGAIRGPRILVTECVRCDDCERLYNDKDKCPHWVVIERTQAKHQDSPLVQIESKSA